MKRILISLFFLVSAVFCFGESFESYIAVPFGSSSEKLLKASENHPGEITIGPENSYISFLEINDSILNCNIISNYYFENDKLYKVKRLFYYTNLQRKSLVKFTAYFSVLMNHTGIKMGSTYFNDGVIIYDFFDDYNRNLLQCEINTNATTMQFVITRNNQ